MTDANFRKTGYALMIADNPDQKLQSERETFAPCDFELYSSPLCKSRSQFFYMFLANYKAFFRNVHVLWETRKPTTVLTDDKSLTQFVQSEAIPPALCSACDYVLQVKFKIAEIAG